MTPPWTLFLVKGSAQNDDGQRFTPARPLTKPQIAWRSDTVLPRLCVASSPTMRWVQFLLAERTILFAAAGSILLAIVWICVIGGQESASDRRAREEKRKRDDKRSWREVRGHGRGIGRGAGEGARGGDADRAEARPALPAKEVTTRVVTTDAGPLLLTVEGSDKLPHTIVTVHDVGV